MPFLGQDWRSPGQNWVKTADGWTRFLDGKEHGGCDNERNSYCWKEEFNKENIFHNLNCDVIAKKRKKDQLNNKTRIQYFHQEKWIYVHKGSTKERDSSKPLKRKDAPMQVGDQQIQAEKSPVESHGYCTLGEAFNRLDFSNAILDSRRFNYVVR
ncbi:putative F-box only protein, partial [Naja naja]